MKIGSFFKLVEIQTKVASIIPLIVGILFTLYRYDTIKPLRLLIFFISLICVDMATTAINNLMDYKRAKVKEGYNYEVHNAIVHYGLTVKQVKKVIIILFTIGILAGITLVTMTDFVILLIGILSFGIGILYSYGPIPISRTPLGEIFSGLFMGGLIFFVTIYSQIYEDGYIIANISNGRLNVMVNVEELIIIAIVSMPLILGIANIMLANNICDVEEDIQNKRYTLPYYIGKKRAILLFDILTYGSYVIILGCIIAGILPITTILVIGTLMIVNRNLREFHKIQTKKDTFIVAVKNFILINGSYAITLLLGVIIKLMLK